MDKFSVLFEDWNDDFENRNELTEEEWEVEHVMAGDIRSKPRVFLSRKRDEERSKKEKNAGLLLKQNLQKY